MGLNWSILFTALQKKVTQVSHCICSGSLMQSFCHFNACFWEEFHQECHLLPRHRARLLHNEQLNPAKAGFEMYGRFQFCRIFAPFYGNVPFKKAPNLHAWTSEAEIPKYRLLRCSLFRNRPLCLSWCLFWVTAEGLCHFSACGGLGELLMFLTFCAMISEQTIDTWLREVAFLSGSASHEHFSIQDPPANGFKKTPMHFRRK